MKRFAQPSPGPWWLRAGNGCVQVSDGPTIDKIIAVVTTCDSVGVANARLIGAAPELLNMLQRVVDECAMVDVDKRPVCEVTMEHARRAIARVTGAPTGYRSELYPDQTPDLDGAEKADPVATLRRVLRWYRETTDGEMPAELHDEACRAVGEEAVQVQRKERREA